MEETYLLNHPGVKKKILHGGQGPMPHFPPGTKLVFHFQTLKDNFERTVIDDSRKNKRPTEIFVGKMFKMEVWEVLLTSMRIGEVAEFWCDDIHTGLYPIVSKGMRLAAQGKDPLEGQKHMCGMGNMFHYHSTGFPELDELMREPQPLIFIMELISVGDPFSYKRESWMMEKDEKLEAVPPLHLQGNALVKQGRFREAADKYQEAVLLLRTVQSREMPGHEDYINLGKLIIPLVLNYCQCMLELEEYYEVIEHTTELLEKHKDNLKAVYQRARAHSALCNEEEARQDFTKLTHLDPKFKPIVKEEMKKLGENIRAKHVREKKNYWTTTQEKWNNKAQAATKSNKMEKKKGVKWADENKTLENTTGELHDAANQPGTGNKGQSGLTARDKQEISGTPGNQDGEGRSSEKKGETAQVSKKATEESGNGTGDKELLSTAMEQANQITGDISLTCNITENVNIPVESTNKDAEAEGTDKDRLAEQGDRTEVNDENNKEVRGNKKEEKPPQTKSQSSSLPAKPEKSTKTSKRKQKKKK
ncbi:aryl-hydrocarbon-interacting protein-like 1 [Chanos chanos]|uniref:Aryl-hydrocarbon-interacting protein-like 1 n=1 Tax=Chanos chanos TaxID=29144 RepID=A0A6J2UN01_CHACN|nr:aryl-hydrocarbon-interacting protein-like 1 [Chanos chanos]